MKPGGMTPKKERFAQEVVRGRSQSDAYRSAFNATRMSSDTIHKRASELMRHGWVKGRIAELSARIEEDFVVKTADLLRESHRLATSDASRIIGEGGKVLLPHELDEDTRRAIASFEIDDMGRIKYKFWDKNSALERLFKYRGLFATDNAQQNPPAIYQIALVALQPEKKAK